MAAKKNRVVDFIGSTSQRFANIGIGDPIAQEGEEEPAEAESATVFYRYLQGSYIGVLPMGAAMESDLTALLQQGVVNVSGWDRDARLGLSSVGTPNDRIGNIETMVVQLLSELKEIKARLDLEDEEYQGRIEKLHEEMHEIGEHIAQTKKRVRESMKERGEDPEWNAIVKAAKATKDDVAQKKRS